MNHASRLSRWTRFRRRLPGFIETFVTTLLAALVVVIAAALGGCSTYNQSARPWSVADADPPGAARYVDDGIAAWDRGDYRAAAIAFRLAADSSDASNPRFVQHARAAECQALLMLRDLGALSACSDQLDSGGSYPAPRAEVSLTRSLAAHAAGKSVASWELPTQTLRTALAEKE
jgi:hypothetical protein